MLKRNLLMLPLVLIFRMVPMFVLVLLEKIVKLGYAYQTFLDRNGVHWKTGWRG